MNNLSQTFVEELGTMMLNYIDNNSGIRITEDYLNTMAAELNVKLKALYERHGWQHNEIDATYLRRYFDMLAKMGVISLKEGADEGAVDEVMPEGAAGYSEDEEDLAEDLAEDVAEDVHCQSPCCHYIETNPKPEGWGENLIGNMDAQVWARDFMWVLRNSDVDDDTLVAWFANSIMTGYDVANQKEHPYELLKDEDYVYVDYVEVTNNDYGGLVITKTFATFKFVTLSAAQTFVKHNAGLFDNAKVRMYHLEPKTTFVKQDIN